MEQRLAIEKKVFRIQAAKISSYALSGRYENLAVLRLARNVIIRARVLEGGQKLRSAQDGWAGCFRWCTGRLADKSVASFGSNWDLEAICSGINDECSSGRIVIH